MILVQRFRDLEIGDGVWDYFEDNIRMITLTEIENLHVIESVNNQPKIVLKRLYKFNSGYRVVIEDDTISSKFDFNHVIFTTYDEAKKYKKNIDEFNQKLVYKR